MSARSAIGVYLGVTAEEMRNYHVPSGAPNEGANTPWSSDSDSDDSIVFISHRSIPQITTAEPKTKSSISIISTSELPVDTKKVSSRIKD